MTSVFSQQPGPVEPGKSPFPKLQITQENGSLLIKRGDQKLSGELIQKFKVEVNAQDLMPMVTIESVAGEFEALFEQANIVLVPNWSDLVTRLTIEERATLVALLRKLGYNRKPTEAPAVAGG